MEELIKIQAELKAPKNQVNSFGKYNYRSCEDILEAVKPLLKESDCLLTLTDEVKEAGPIAYVEATAQITNGKDVVFVTAQAGINPNKKGMDIAQSFGSSSSYARKYALNGLFLIDDTKDADATNDHGKNQQSNTQTQQQPAKEELHQAHPKWNDVIRAVSEGKANLAYVKKKFIVSKEIEDIVQEKHEEALENFNQQNS